jgi:methylmalonyl-CoA/ethylmalonyl-CoA epimerase
MEGENMNKNKFLFKRINHIGIVVRDLSEALKAYSIGFGSEAAEIVEIPEAQLKVSVIKTENAEVELLEYQNRELPLVKSLRGDKAGINHVCYEVEEMEEALKKLKKKGFKIIEGFPRRGVHGKIAFLVPPHTIEERIEILEVEK